MKLLVSFIFYRSLKPISKRNEIDQSEIDFQSDGQNKSVIFGTFFVILSIHGIRLFVRGMHFAFVSGICKEEKGSIRIW